MLEVVEGPRFHVLTEEEYSGVYFRVGKVIVVCNYPPFRELMKLVRLVTSFAAAVVT